MAVRSIVIVAFPGVQALDITGPHEVSSQHGEADDEVGVMARGISIGLRG